MHSPTDSPQCEARIITHVNPGEQEYHHYFLSPQSDPIVRPADNKFNNFKDKE